MFIDVQLVTVILTFVGIVVPILLIRRLSGILRIISISFSGFVGLLGFYYLFDYLNYYDFAETIIKPSYLSVLIVTGLLMLIYQKKENIKNQIFKNEFS